MKEIQDKARDAMKGYCRVCPVCDGVRCPTGVPGMGGAGTGASFRANVECLSDIRLSMRVIHDVVDPDTTTELFGIPMDLPVMVAPIGGMSFNIGGAITEREWTDSVVFGARERGIISCTGDGVPPEISGCGFESVTEAGGHGIPFIKPWEDDELFEKLAAAKKTGAPAVGIDIDAAGLITLRLMGRPVGPKTVEQLKMVKEFLGDTKFILKGIMTPDQAELAVAAGADGIVVSNHGGRVLDMMPGTADVLPDIADAVRGRLAILVDGGVRSGVDILKMLALGADGVLIGRPFMTAAISGKDGVTAYIDQLKLELRQAMVLTGCASVKDADESLLY